VATDRQRRLRRHHQDGAVRRPPAQEERLTRIVTLPPEQQLAPALAAYNSAVAAKRQQHALGAVLLLLAIVAGGVGAEVNLATFFGKLGNFSDYFNRLLTLDTGARVWTDPAEWFWGLGRWARLLGETILIAYVGTTTGAALAFAACFLTSRNLMPSAAVRMLVRRLLEFCRTVPDLVFALIFVAAFGLGALPGVLALAIHTTGALGKLFSEVVENIDEKPVTGVAASGGGWFAQVRFGVLPQVLSNFASYALLRFEINVRAASIIGFVGAGGIGLDLIVAIRKFFYSDISAILLLIVLTVMLIDAASERLRHRLLAFEVRA
jgi:phosphonate transport system permease protein